MQIIFTSKKLKRSLTVEKEMVKVYGAECAKLLKLRLMNLYSAPSMDKIPPKARCHPLSGKYQGCFAVDLKHPYRLIFRPYLEELPLKIDGGLDLSLVDAIKIVDVVDYH